MQDPARFSAWLVRVEVALEGADREGLAVLGEEAAALVCGERAVGVGTYGCGNERNGGGLDDGKRVVGTKDMLLEGEGVEVVEGGGMQKSSAPWRGLQQPIEQPSA